MEMFSGFVNHEVDFAPSGGLQPNTDKSPYDYSNPQFRKSIWIMKGVNKSGHIIDSKGDDSYYHVSLSYRANTAVGVTAQLLRDCNYKDNWDIYDQMAITPKGFGTFARCTRAYTPMTDVDDSEKWEYVKYWEGTYDGNYKTNYNCYIKMYYTGIYDFEVYFIDSNGMERTLTRISVQVDGIYMNDINPYLAVYWYYINQGRMEKGEYETDTDNPFYGYHGYTYNGLVWAFSDTSVITTNVYIYAASTDTTSEDRQKSLDIFSNGIKYTFCIAYATNNISAPNESDTPPVITLKERGRVHLRIYVLVAGTLLVDEIDGLEWFRTKLWISDMGIETIPSYVSFPSSQPLYVIFDIAGYIPIIPNRIRKAAGQSYIGTYEDGTTIPIMKSNKTFTGVNGAEFQGSMIGDGIATPDGDIYSYMEAGREYVLNE